MLLAGRITGDAADREVGIVAKNEYNWNTFMERRQTQLFLYGICVVCCLFYAVDGVLELMSPERSAVMIDRMGSAGYYAMTIIRTVVLVITAVAFGRVAYKNLKDKQ